MNIQSVQAFDAAVGQLGAIKGDVTQNQLEELTNLFSTKIWNTSDTEGTKANLEAQIQKLQALLDEIQAEIDDLYAEQKQHNEQMNRLLDDINNESYQASKQMDQNAKQQQELVENATDDVYRRYMKGEISKDEIPTEIAKALGKMNPSAATKLQASLDQMDVYGQKIYSLSDKIAGILDNVNELTAKMKTTETSIGLMQQLLAQVPEHKERAVYLDVSASSTAAALASGVIASNSAFLASSTFVEPCSASFNFAVPAFPSAQAPSFTTLYESINLSPKASCVGV